MTKREVKTVLDLLAHHQRINSNQTDADFIAFQLRCSRGRAQEMIRAAKAKMARRSDDVPSEQ